MWIEQKDFIEDLESSEGTSYSGKSTELKEFDGKSFNRQIEKNKIDKALKYKFQREKEGIFNWALEGLKRLYENNFEFSENELTDGVKKEYKRENNNVISFVEECCELDGLFSCSRIEIYEAYKEFCVEAGLKALSQIKFNKELREGRRYISK